MSITHTTRSATPGLPITLPYSNPGPMNFRQLAYGILSYLPLSPDQLTPRTGGTESAEYCYCIWLRHLVLAMVGGMESFPRTIAELGPGDSLGVGMAALISGAESYSAFDAVPHADRNNDLEIFDQLVALFRARAPIPDLKTFPEMVLDLPSYAFPDQLLDDEHMRIALDSGRLQRLRQKLSDSGGTSGVMSYRAPWDAPEASELESIDLLISNAVLEHVTDIDGAYRSIRDWLKVEGWSTHQIDFRSHGLFRGWDGHWACPDWLWTLMKGRRAYLLNRQPLSQHLGAIERSGLSVVYMATQEREPERKHLSARFSDLDQCDRRTSVAFMSLRKVDH